MIRGRRRCSHGRHTRGRHTRRRHTRRRPFVTDIGPGATPFLRSFRLPSFRLRSLWPRVAARDQDFWPFRVAAQHQKAARVDLATIKWMTTTSADEGKRTTGSGRQEREHPEFAPPRRPTAPPRHRVTASPRHRVTASPHRAASPLPLLFPAAVCRSRDSIPSYPVRPRRCRS